MNILLVAINAKYIHSNLAVHSLRAYGEKTTGEKIAVAEYTINQPEEDILKDIYRRRPDWLGFSCYIWNINTVKVLLPELRKLLPDCEIWLGGPEVSFEGTKMLEKFPDADGIMKGEGEQIFADLLGRKLNSEGKIFEKNLQTIPGIVYRGQGRVIAENEGREPMDMDALVFPYEDIGAFENRIIYYETSRGCPFGCKYCLSSVDKKLRFRSMEKVKKELQIFLDAGVPQVKFVDRTFNCRHEHSMEILRFIKERDNGITNFHFEIAGDLLTKEEIELIQSLRPGLIQLEIGVQSTNPDTLSAVGRRTEFTVLKDNVAALLKNQNVHLHLDLIAGLPLEDYGSFRKSFNEVYAMQGHELQLGFLKLLIGSPLRGEADQYGIVGRDTAPYEVLWTDRLSYEDVLRLKEAEEMLEIYHNSGQFLHGEKMLLSYMEDAFSLYEKLADFYKVKNYPVMLSSRLRRYEILLEFFRECVVGEECVAGREDAASAEKDFCRCLTLDYYLRENAKARPSFAQDLDGYKQKMRAFYESEEKTPRFLSGYEGYGAKQLARMTHMEAGEDGLILFDYRHRDAVTGNALLIRGIK